MWIIKVWAINALTVYAIFSSFALRALAVSMGASRPLATFILLLSLSSFFLIRSFGIYSMEGSQFSWVRNGAIFQTKAAPDQFFRKIGASEAVLVTKIGNKWESDQTPTISTFKHNAEIFLVDFDKSTDSHGIS